MEAPLKMPFHFKKLAIPDVILIEPLLHKDDRGFLIETYKRSEFVREGIKEEFVQENHSRSAKNVLRGLHYQLNPMAQGKLVLCVKGSIFDVSVDVRKHSPTCGKWIGMELSESNHYILYIPVGCAHGFAILSDSADVFYKTTKEYSLEHERGILWKDPTLDIKWPITNPILSEKDARNPPFSEMRNN